MTASTALRKQRRSPALEAALTLTLLGASSCASQGDDAPDAGPAAPPRTATTRALLPTATSSLLLDPFTTADHSWGHFFGFIPPTTPSGASQGLAVKRLYWSPSPVGVAAPIARVDRLEAVSAAAKSAQIVAPFPGGSGRFTAQIWVSARDGTGAPVDEASLEKGLVISLLPNDLPGQKVVLERGAEAPLRFGAEAWVKLALAAAVPLAEGGWFSISIEDPSRSFAFAAPEVTPEAHASRQGSARIGARSAEERSALAAYRLSLRAAPQR